MTAHIALLRGVNVGGKRKVSMAELQAAFVGMGFAGARTLLNSGNVVFRSDRKTTPAALEGLLEAELERRLGLWTDIHIRTAAEWRVLIDANPLPEIAASHASRFILWCMKKAPDAAAVEALCAANPGPEIVRASGRHLYVDYSVLGGGESRLTPALMDRKLGTPGTGRNWNTVLKLAVLAGAS